MCFNVRAIYSTRTDRDKTCSCEGLNVEEIFSTPIFLLITSESACVRYSFCYTRACIARNVHLADRECSVIEGAAKLTANLPILRSRNGNSTRTCYRKPVLRLRWFVIASLRGNFHFHPFVYGYPWLS